MDRKPIEMLRLPRQEQYFDREEVFGRDVTSVFPTQSKKEAAEAAKSVVDALGAKKFISETELEEIKKTRGGTVEDGTVSVDKSLAEQLAENKAKKDADFQEVWRKMKEGTQRPLNQEEVEFLDTVLHHKSQRERDAEEEQRRELEAFREALKHRTVVAVPSRPGPSGGQMSAQEESAEPAVKAVRPTAPQAPKYTIKPVIKPIIKARPKGSKVAPPGSHNAGAELLGEPSTSGPEKGGAHHGVDLVDSRSAAQVGEKRGREDNAGDTGAQADGDEGGGLAGLLGGYSSDSDAG